MWRPFSVTAAAFLPSACKNASHLLKCSCNTAQFFSRDMKHFDPNVVRSVRVCVCVCVCVWGVVYIDFVFQLFPQIKIIRI
jgi:predicted small secreted protein